MNKNEIIAAYATHEGDTGSPEVQIALLTSRINNLNEHLKKAATAVVVVLVSLQVLVKIVDTACEKCDLYFR